MSQSPLQHLASIQNSQKSTGPRTEEGKAASSQNALKHGFSSRFALLPWEKPDEYYELYDAFAEEFPYANDAEKELLDSLVQARWLVRRSILLQELCFDADIPSVNDPNLALYLRYQTTHERSFQKAYTALRKIKADREKVEIAAARQETAQQLGFFRKCQRQPDSIVPGRFEFPVCLLKFTGQASGDTDAEFSETSDVVPNEAVTLSHAHRLTAPLFIGRASF